MQNLINKHLLERKSDLIVTGELDVDILTDGYSGTLPSDFSAMAEKPKVHVTAETHGYRPLRPIYLNDDEHDDREWWDYYGFFGEDIPCLRPSTYKIIGSTLYVRPKVTQDVTITGKYFATPTSFSTPTDIIPWEGKFNELFREGMVMILVKGIAITDQGLKGYLEGGIDAVVNARMNLIPNTRRLGRGDFI